MRTLFLSALPPDSRPRAAPRYGAGGRIVGARAHSSAAYARWKDAAAAEARTCWGDNPPAEGPLDVRICAVLPPPKAARPIAGAPRRWAPRKPDVDNVAKGVLDALTDAGVWGDDAQVVSLSVHRCWGAVAPRVRGGAATAEVAGVVVYVAPVAGEPGRW